MKLETSKKVKGEVHDLLKKRGPRFSIAKDKSKVIPRKAKYGKNKIFWLNGFSG